MYMKKSKEKVLNQKVFLVNKMEENTSIGRLIGNIGIVAIICIIIFLIAKYLVYSELIITK